MRNPTPVIMSSISTESLSNRNENGMDSPSILIQLKRLYVCAGAPYKKQPKATNESKNGIRTKPEANTPAVIPFNLLKLKEIRRNPIRGNNGISQIYLSIVLNLSVYHFSLLSTLISMVWVDR